MNDENAPSIAQEFVADFGVAGGGFLQHFGRDGRRRRAFIPRSCFQPVARNLFVITFGIFAGRP